MYFTSVLDCAAPLTILVTEDDEDSRELYVEVLKHAGFVVRGVADVAAARAVLEKLKVDVLVADYSMPDGSAADLMTLCRAAAPKVCILLTGHDAHDVDATGFHVVLTKPVTGDALVKAIHAYVPRPGLNSD